MVTVFDFRFSECSGAGDGPIDWLFTAIDEVLFYEAGKGFEFSGFILGMNGPIFIFPVGEHA